MKSVELEKSTNTHKVTAKEIIVVQENNSVVVLDISGDGIVTHGEHGEIKTESQHVIKYVQKEINPITKKIEDAND